MGRQFCRPFNNRSRCLARARAQADRRHPRCSPGLRDLLEGVRSSPPLPLSQRASAAGGLVQTK
eukprot:7848324-Alexandrium_andersonii.AAC.1